MLKFTLYFCNAILIDFIFDGMYNIINYVGRPRRRGYFEKKRYSRKVQCENVRRYRLPQTGQENTRNRRGGNAVFGGGVVFALLFGTGTIANETPVPLMLIFFL